MINLIKGKLPWSNLRSLDNSLHYKKVCIYKKGISNEKLCESCPRQFVTYMNYVMKLEFNERPDYNFVRQLVMNEANLAKLDIFDGVFDWSLLLTSYDHKNPLLS